MTKIIKALLTLALLSFCFACGGGSGGTDGGETFLISGTVVNANGFAAGNISITDISSGRQTKTAANGKFQLLGTAAEQTIELQFERGVEQTVVSVSTLGAVNNHLTLDFSISVSSFSVEVIDPAIDPTPTDENSSISPTPSLTPPNTNPDDDSSEAPFSVISGTVTDSSGNPISRVTVQINSARYSDITDTQGFFRIEFPSKRSSLSITLSIADVSVSTLLNEIPTGQVRIAVELVLRGFGSTPIPTATREPDGGPSSMPSTAPTPTEVAVSVKSVSVRKKGP